MEEAYRRARIEEVMEFDGQYVILYEDGVGYVTGTLRVKGAEIFLKDIEGVEKRIGLEELNVFNE